MNKLSEQMKKAKLEPRDLAYKMGVSQLIVSQWIAGRQTPRLLHALKIMAIFPKIKPIDLLKPKDLEKLYQEA